MLKKVTCLKHSSILEYDDQSDHEGNKDFDCPICDYTIAIVFIDFIPVTKHLKLILL